MGERQPLASFAVNGRVGSDEAEALRRLRRDAPAREDAAKSSAALSH